MLFGEEWRLTVVLLGVGGFPAGTAQDIGQGPPRKTHHSTRLDVAQQIVESLVLIAVRRWPVVDPIVHVDDIDALVHNPGMVVMVVGKEVQLAPQLLGDQGVGVPGRLLYQKDNNFRIAIEALSSRQGCQFHHRLLTANELRFIRLQGMKSQKSGIRLTKSQD